MVQIGEFLFTGLDMRFYFCDSALQGGDNFGALGDNFRPSAPLVFFGLFYIYGAIGVTLPGFFRCLAGRKK